MDTSQEYIKMCEKAEEIQTHQSEYHDWYICATHRNVLEEDSGMFFDGQRNDCPDDYGQGRKIWLPRQDQLQEMVGLKNDKGMLIHSWSSLAQVALVEVNDNYPQRIVNQFTLEQLWLAFVMKEKYGKTWNGQDWINHSTFSGQ